MANCCIHNKSAFNMQGCCMLSIGAALLMFLFSDLLLCPSMLVFFNLFFFFHHNLQNFHYVHPPRVVHLNYATHISTFCCLSVELLFIIELKVAKWW